MRENKVNPWVSLGFLVALPLASIISYKYFSTSSYKVKMPGISGSAEPGENDLERKVVERKKVFEPIVQGKLIQDTLANREEKSYTIGGVKYTLSFYVVAFEMGLYQKYFNEGKLKDGLGPKISFERHPTNEQELTTLAVYGVKKGSEVKVDGGLVLRIVKYVNTSPKVVENSADIGPRVVEDIESEEIPEPVAKREFSEIEEVEEFIRQRKKETAAPGSKAEREIEEAKKRNSVSFILGRYR